MEPYVLSLQPYLEQGLTYAKEVRIEGFGVVNCGLR
jgi:hypothetical protein